MRILLVSDELEDQSMGGPRVLTRLQAELRALGQDCDLWFRAQIGGRPRSQRLRWAVSPWLTRQAVRRCAADYDVMDASSAQGCRLPRGAVLVARSHGLEHRYYGELLADARAGLLHKPWTHRLWYPPTCLRQVELALRRARRIIVPNAGDRDFIVSRRWAPAESVEVIPHGVEAAEWRGAPAATATRGGGLLFCGWWTTSKGVAYLAAAYAQLLAAGDAPPLTLLGVARPGAGWAEEERRIRQQFPAAAQSRLRLLPRTLDQAAVTAAYRAHDLLVCPSTSEGFGLVVLEALSQRLPVVCTAVAGVAHWLRHGHDAWLVASRDAAALAAAITTLWQNAEMRRALAEAGYQTAAALSWAAVARQTLACYQRAREEQSREAAA
ncbi:MAG TPA: glycosyltransferase family 4 protein [Terriglobales bacterium]|nr:glycosyltransferase family 4 protein [Terriglobales bacterium]